MLGLVVAAILGTIYDPSIASVMVMEGENLGIGPETAARIIATLLVIAAVSISSAVLAGISFLRRESPMPAAIALCLAVSCLGVLIVAVIGL